MRFIRIQPANPWRVSAAGEVCGGDVNAAPLAGSAPYGVRHVFIENRPAQRAEWTNDTAWKLTSVPLNVGENAFTLIGMDQAGRTLREFKLTVTRKAGETGGR